MKGGESLPYELKKILVENCDMSGSHQRWGENQVSFLTGLQYAGVAGAGELIDAIREHGEVELWLE